MSVMMSLQSYHSLRQMAKLPICCANCICQILSVSTWLAGGILKFHSVNLVAVQGLFILSVLKDNQVSVWPVLQ